MSALDHLARRLAEYGEPLDGVSVAVEGGRLVCYVDASDLFDPATADGARYEEGDERLLDSVLSDLGAVGRLAVSWWAELYACRKRGQSPMPARLGQCPPGVRALLEGGTDDPGEAEEAH
ncbi:MAG TPA: hypothetical protein VF288_10785 [Mycobacteriales bacterium]